MRSSAFPLRSNRPRGRARTCEFANLSGRVIKHAGPLRKLGQLAELLCSAVNAQTDARRACRELGVLACSPSIDPWFEAYQGSNVPIRLRSALWQMRGRGWFSQRAVGLETVRTVLCGA